MKKQIQITYVKVDGKRLIDKIDYDSINYSDLFCSLISEANADMVYVAEIDGRPFVSTNIIDLCTGIESFVEWHYKNVLEEHANDVFPIGIAEHDTVDGALMDLSVTLHECLFEGSLK